MSEILVVAMDDHAMHCLGEPELDVWWASLDPEAKAAMYAESLESGDAATSELRRLEQSLAFERAAGVIESSCLQGPNSAGDYLLDTYDITTSELDLSEEIEYLDSRPLLRRDAVHPHIVTICDEDEPVPLSEAAR